jgi:hypothetical protein
MSPRLLTLLDVLRFTLGKPIVISTHKDALGRKLGPTSQSCHNVDVWGEVLAADFFCPWMNGQDQVRHVFNTMRDLGFTGIGVYADTKPGVMFHGDVRTSAIMGQPATWGRVNGKYVSINEAIGSCTFS